MRTAVLTTVLFSTLGAAALPSATAGKRRYASSAVRKTSAGKKESPAKYVVTMVPSIADVPSLKQVLSYPWVHEIRFNLSHGNEQIWEKWLTLLHEAERQVGRKIKVVFDFPGRKNRIGEGAADLRAGATVEIHYGSKRVPITRDGFWVDFPDLHQYALPGKHVYLSDRALALEVLATDPNQRKIVARVVQGGHLESRAGFAVEDGEPTYPSEPGPDDLSRMSFLKRVQPDYVVHSMGQNADQVLAFAERALRETGQRIKVLFKVESQRAVNNIEDILSRLKGKISGVVIGRGDMTQEFGQVVARKLQKRIAAACKKLGIPITIATGFFSKNIGYANEARDVTQAIKRDQAWFLQDSLTDDVLHHLQTLDRQLVWQSLH